MLDIIMGWVGSISDQFVELAGLTHHEHESDRIADQYGFMVGFSETWTVSVPVHGYGRARPLHV